MGGMMCNKPHCQSTIVYATPGFWFMMNHNDAAIILEMVAIIVLG